MRKPSRVPNLPARWRVNQVADESEGGRVRGASGQSSVGSWQEAKRMGDRRTLGNGSPVDPISAEARSVKSVPSVIQPGQRTGTGARHWRR